MKILFNAPPPTLQGGPPTHLSILQQELSKHVALIPYSYGRRTDTETIITKAVHRILDLIRLHRLIRKTRPDLIHHNTAFDTKTIVRDAPLAWLAKFHDIPLIVKVHGSHSESFGPVNLVVLRLRESLLRNVTCLAVLSEVEKNEFTRTWPNLEGRVEVVKNIIREEFTGVQRRESEYPTVLFISRFIEKKGILDLLRAVPLVLKQFPNAKFTFAGSGVDAPKFCDEVKQRQLESSVAWVTNIEHLDTTKFYSSAWVFAFPTRFPEGMPMVVAEAMAAGVPIVTTRTRFSLSYMLEGKHCLFVDYKRPESISEKIVTLLEDRELRDHMSENNRLLARQFTPDLITSEFLNLYKALCAA